MNQEIHYQTSVIDFDQNTNTKKQNTLQTLTFLWLWILELPAKPDREPVENLSDGDKADSKAKSTDATKPRDEVQQSLVCVD